MPPPSANKNAVAPFRFNPKMATEVLGDTLPDEMHFVKTYMFARLLIWATLDQRARGQAVKLNAKGGRKLKLIKSARAGRAVLAYFLDEYVHARRQRNTESLIHLYVLARASGGFLALSSPRSLFRDLKRHQQELSFVHQIVHYVCRSSIATLPSQLEDAKEFLHRSYKTERSYGVSNISQIWERHKDAAPYIFAFYPLLKRLPHRADPHRVLKWLERYVSKPQRMDRLLGKAAWVADILDSRRVRHVRTRDFINVVRVPCSLRHFTPKELGLIAEIDPANRIRAASVGGDLWRPKVKRPGSR